jgi:peroxiredoxin
VAVSILFSGCINTGMEVGQKVPDFFFYDLNGKKVRIYDHLNHKKILLLHFWGAACCFTYSAQTIKAVSSIYQFDEFDDVEVISVNLDYPSPKVKKITDELQIKHLMLTDRDSLYYLKEPELKFFFPLALILAVDEKGIIRGKLKGPQMIASIEEVLLSARNWQENSK